MKMQPNHLKAMLLNEQVKFNQRHIYNIPADGMYGPKTAEAINCNEFADIVGGWLPEKGSLICAMATAARSVGMGGDGVNNRGEWLSAMRLQCGLPDNDGSWCAVFASWCFWIAHGGNVPFDVSSGARALAENVALHLNDGPPGPDGLILLDDVQDLDYGIATWYRGGESWMRHIRFWAYRDGYFYTIGGNEDPGDRVWAGCFTRYQFEKKLDKLIRF